MPSFSSLYMLLNFEYDSTRRLGNPRRLFCAINNGLHFFSLAKQGCGAYNKTMKVNVEFLDTDPIENVITCLNYKMDKVVYFGYPEVVAQYRRMTEEFLR